MQKAWLEKGIKQRLTQRVSWRQALTVFAIKSAIVIGKRASFSLACLVFSLIGVPLAITARRRDTSTGFAIGIMVAALYFVALVFCETSRKSGGITPYILLWLPNVLGIAFAIWQHAKAKYRG